MLLLDRWLGVPLCLLLTGVRRVLGQLPRRGFSLRRILFIKLAEQGSTVLAYPVLKEAARRVGRENVFMMVFDDNRFILDALGVIPPENIIPLRHGNLLALCSDVLSALVRVHRLRIDAAVDLEFFARSTALLSALTAAPARVGFHAYCGEGPYRGNLLTHRVRYNPHLHTTAAFSSLLHALDQPPEAFPRFDHVPEKASVDLPLFRASTEEMAQVRALLAAHKEESAETPLLILLNANASDLIPLRRWAPENYVALARKLLGDFPAARIAFTGAQAEAGRSQALVRQVGDPRCFSVAGQTSLRQLLTLFTLADVLVTNDSGPAHFAALTPIHTVTLFGPETPLLFSSLNPRDTPLWAGLACSPCVSALNHRQSACRNNACMARITVDQVLDAVRSCCQARHPARRELGLARR